MLGQGYGSEAELLPRVPEALDSASRTIFPKLQNLTFRASLMECLQWLCRAGRAFLLGVGCDPALHFFHC